MNGRSSRRRSLHPTPSRSASQRLEAADSLPTAFSAAHRFVDADDQRPDADGRESKQS
jgi:hypothetical protein